MVAPHRAPYRTRLKGTFKEAGDLVAILRDLHLLDNRGAVVDIRGIDRPVSLRIVRRQFCKRQNSECERQPDRAKGLPGCGGVGGGMMALLPGRGTLIGTVSA